MTEITYLPEVRCSISPGFRSSDITVMLTDVEGRQQFIHLDRSMVNTEHEESFLSIGIVEIDRRKRRVLIELPVEADSGANRMWVGFEDLRQEVGVVA